MRKTTTSIGVDGGGAEGPGPPNRNASNDKFVP